MSRRGWRCGWRGDQPPLASRTTSSGVAMDDVVSLVDAEALLQTDVTASAVDERRIDGMLLEALRVSDRYALLLERAAGKRRLLERLAFGGVGQVEPHEPDDALAHWYFVERLGRDVPFDLKAYARRLGWSDSKLFGAHSTASVSILIRLAGERRKPGRRPSRRFDSAEPPRARASSSPPPNAPCGRTYPPRVELWPSFPGSTGARRATDRTWYFRLSRQNVVIRATRRWS